MLVYLLQRQQKATWPWPSAVTLWLLSSLQQNASELTHVCQLFSLKPPHQVYPRSTGYPDPPGQLRPPGGWGPRPGAWAQHHGPERRLQPSSPAAQPGTHPHPLCHLPAAMRLGHDPEPLTCERENHSSTAKYCHAVHEGAYLEACPHTGTPEGVTATFWWLAFPPSVSSPVSSWL